MSAPRRHRHDFPLALITRLEAAHVPRFAAAMRTARAAAQTGLALPVAVAALAHGDVEAAVNAVPWDVFSQALLPGTERAFLLAMAAAGRSFAPEVPVRKARRPKTPALFTARFDLTNPRAIEAARRYSYDLVTNVTEETRRAIRAVIVAGQTGGNLTVDAQARILRDVVGLNVPQANAAMAFDLGLRESGDFTEEQIAERVARQVDAYAADRAETIARTETNRALNAGQDELWAQAQEDGFLGADAQRVLVAAPDACEICLALDGVPVGLDEPWVTETGEEIDQPPVHPRCRCSMAIEDPGSVDPGSEAEAAFEEDAAA